jgi:hypothetical protein
VQDVVAPGVGNVIKSFVGLIIFQMVKRHQRQKNSILLHAVQIQMSTVQEVITATVKKDGDDKMKVWVCLLAH